MIYIFIIPAIKIIGHAGTRSREDQGGVRSHREQGECMERSPGPEQTVQDRQGATQVRIRPIRGHQADEVVQKCGEVLPPRARQPAQDRNPVFGGRAGARRPGDCLPKE